MFRFIKIAPGIVIAALAVAPLAFPAAAFAQDVPSYADSADSGSGNSDETVHGRVDSIDGTFDLRVDDDRGFVDRVHLHQGTIINPTGLTLAPGMDVTILGYDAGPVLEANEIDTPYAYDGPAPVPVYYGPGWWYPGYSYGYGPSFSLALVFGGGGWHYAHQPWSGHWYDSHPWNGYRNGYRGGGSTNAPLGGSRSYGTEARSIAPAAGTGFQASAGDRFAQPSGWSRSGGPAAYTGASAGTYRGGAPVTYRGGGSTATYRGGSTATYRGGSTATYHGGSRGYASTSGGNSRR